jgi:hypothetical protein
MAKFAKLRNIKTGVEFVVDTKVSRYRRLAQGFLNKLKLEPRFVKMITLTQGKESYHPKILNTFLTNLRTFYEDISYLWTVEVQEKRYLTSGEKVLHWHILVGFPWEHKFTGDDVRRLDSWWQYGTVEVTPAPDRYRSVSYLMKYISKSLSSPLLDEYDIRRIGSSKLAGYLRQSWKRLTDALSHFTAYGWNISDYTWRYGRAYVVGHDIETFEAFTDCIYRPPPSEWQFEKMDSDDDVF